MIKGTAPGFWWREAGWQARLLAPAAALYASVAARRLRVGAAQRAEVPVLCVGNFTAGGAGKTPAALALGRAARARGHRPGFLTRGHGGSQREPLLVDPGRHDSGLTGDEPLLLAREAPTVVSRDRSAGARMLAETCGCDLVIMDDGFQSARLAIDLAVLVVDGRRGLGNRRVLPAGPLRAPLGVQLAHAQAVLISGRGEAGENAARTAREAGLPVHRANLRALDAEVFAGRSLLAFAGIADPGKFYASLGEIGANIVRRRDFPDHHPFTMAEIGELESAARDGGLRLATTAKDAVRLVSSAAGRALLSEALVLEVELDLEGEAGRALVDGVFEAFEASEARQRA